MYYGNIYNGMAEIADINAKTQTEEEEKRAVMYYGKHFEELDDDEKERIIYEVADIFGLWTV